MDSAKDQKNSMGIRTPHDLIQHVKKIEPAEGESLELEMRKFKPLLIVNIEEAYQTLIHLYCGKHKR